MEKEFVPYELTLKLIELGFNFKSLGGYVDGELFLWQDNDTTSFIHYEIEAPLWSQAFDWFRVEHGHYGDIYRNGTKYLFSIEDMNIGSSRDSIDTPMGYEEARQACLEKLIELCKNN